MKFQFLKYYLILSTIFFGSINFLIAQKYIATLSGPNESPPNASLGIGQATITINGYYMRVQCTFSGLLAGVSAAHIHAATAVAFTGTAGVATVTPSFTSFPSGVVNGTYDYTFDMSLSSSFNPAYVTAHGGTVAQAWADLQAAMVEGKSYFNIHTSIFPGGEIRGFLITPSCSSTKTGNWDDISVWNCGHVPTNLENVIILPGHVVSISANYVANVKNIEINGEINKGANSTLIFNK